MPLEYVQKSGVKEKKNVVSDFKVNLIFHYSFGPHARKVHSNTLWAFSCMRNFSLLTKIKVSRVAHLNLPSLGGWWVLMPRPAAFRIFRQKYSCRSGTIPLSLRGRLPNWMYCMHKCQRGGSAAGTRPGTLPRWVGVRLCKVTPTPWKGDWGLHGVENVEVLCDSCQVMHIFLHEKKSLHLLPNIDKIMNIYVNLNHKVMNVLILAWFVCR